jgi:hypothetical protein
MENAMNILTCDTLDTGAELPGDLRSWLDEQEVLGLALESVQSLAANDAAFRQLRFETFRPQMMLTLLAYCYATDTYGSDDVEWAADHETSVRYICGGQRPDRQTVRRFRRVHRSRIEGCLTSMFKEALARRSGEDDAGQASVWAGRKLDLAVLTDTAAAD